VPDFVVSAIRMKDTFVQVEDLDSNRVEREFSMTLKKGSKAMPASPPAGR
jgi:hypothetical protein